MYVPVSRAPEQIKPCLKCSNWLLSASLLCILSCLCLESQEDVKYCLDLNNIGHRACLSSIQIKNACLMVLNIVSSTAEFTCISCTYDFFKNSPFYWPHSPLLSTRFVRWSTIYAIVWIGMFPKRSYSKDLVPRLWCYWDVVDYSGCEAYCKEVRSLEVCL